MADRKLAKWFLVNSYAMESICVKNLWPNLIQLLTFSFAEILVLDTFLSITVLSLILLAVCQVSILCFMQLDLFLVLYFLKP